MAETVPVISEDKRLESIADQLINYANADFSAELKISDKRDHIDSIIVGLNLLGEELMSHIQYGQQREEELKEALFRLNEAQRLALIGSWEWDIPDNKIAWTDELYRLYGVNQKEFDSTFENYMKFIHPEDRDLVNNIVQQAYQNKNPFNFFHRIIRADGRIRIHHSRGEVFTDASGQAFKMTGTAQDVTQIKEAENKNHALAAIVESSGDVIISKTLTGHITSWNRRAEEVFGYKSEELLGKHISILFPSDRLHEEETIISRIKESKALVNFETQRKRKDGTLIDVAVTISPILDEHQKIIGVSKIARDITEKKKVEEKLKRYTQELEHKNNETQQFSYIASHDLQEPLRTITNYINLFAEDYHGKLDDNADVYIKFISNAASRMQVLIHDLLEYTRIDLDNNLQDVDCDMLVKEVIQNMELTVSETNSRIISGPLPLIKGYKTRLYSLFQNLISNAIKFRKKDTNPEININAEDKGENWVFTVSDNGIGIEDQYFEKIFKLFQRLHARNEFEGTGIGLAHCKKIVELRGGKIWVQSKPGEGSTFYISLPKKVML